MIRDATGGAPKKQKTKTKTKQTNPILIFCKAKRVELLPVMAGVTGTYVRASGWLQGKVLDQGAELQAKGLYPYKIVPYFWTIDFFKYIVFFFLNINLNSEQIIHANSNSLFHAHLT